MSQCGAKLRIAFSVLPLLLLLFSLRNDWAMIIGTAGHIDHGKTSLVRILTGMDTDRLAEEKRRGMSIDLGFAFMELPGGKKAGIVDVPGHENFIRNMVAGVQGIDMALMVIAADDGVMPQTREHLDIIDLLGVTDGIIAVTKTDMVDASRIDAVCLEISGLFKDSCLKKAKLIPISSVTGSGIDELRKEISICAETCVQKNSQAIFRMPVDRSFAVKGFGTVVTGTVLSGHISTGDTVRLFPGGRELRVRTLEAYGEERKEISAGDRCAINIAGIEKQALGRGDMLTATGLMRDTTVFDAKIRQAAFSKKVLKAGEKVHLHTGTTDCIASFHPAGDAYASFRLNSPLQLVRGDRFVVRDYSAKQTICGGTVINPFPPRLKGRDKAACIELWDTGDMAAMAEDILQRRTGPVHISEVSENLGIAPEKLIPLLESSGCFRSIEGELFIEERLKLAETEICSLLEIFHKSSPSATGIEAETIRQQLKYKLPPSLFGEIIVSLVKGDKIEQSGAMLRLCGHGVRLSPQEQKLRDEIMAELKEKGYQTASVMFIAGKDRRKTDMLNAMAREGIVVQLSRESYLPAALLDEAKKRLLEHFSRKETITVIEYKDILEVGRKGPILILEYFDKTHLTLRRGDDRILMKKG